MTPEPDRRTTSTRRYAGVLLFAIACALPEPVPATVTEFGRADGLPSQQIHAATQGGDGRLYFAGPSGLTVYDGQRTTVLGTNAGLTTHGLRSIATRRDGLLAVGGDAGLDLQRPDGRFERVGGESWDRGFVEDILPLADGSLYIAAARGLLRWRPEQGAEPIAEALVGMNLVTALAQVGETTWASGPETGLLCGQGNDWQRPGNDDWRRVGAVTAIADSRRETLLVGGEQGLVEIDGDGRVVASLDETARVSALLTSTDGTWAGLGNRLVRLERRGDRLRVAEVRRDNTIVNHLYADAIGSVWVATDNRGVLRVSALREIVRQPAAPCDAAVMSVRPRAGGALLVAGDLCSWIDDGDEQQRIPALDGLKTWDLFDHDGSTWAATDSGLFELTGVGSSRRHGDDSEILGAPGRVFAEVDGSLWAGTVRGVSRRRMDGDWEPVPLAGDERPGYVYTLLPAGDAVWVGSIGQGLWRWSGRQLQRAGIAGLPPTGNAYAVAVAPDGRLAVAQDDALFLVEDGQARRLPAAGDDAVGAWSLAFDGDTLWAGTSSGLRELDAASGEQRRHYTRGLGLADEEFTTSRSLLLDDGRIVAATAAGLTVLEPARIAGRVTAPAVRSAGVAWRNAELADDGSVRSGPWTVDVHYYAPWYFDERSLSFRHRLSGFDEDWSAGSSRPLAHYTALPAGRYTLYAQARAPLTGWGPEREVWTVSVAPPAWLHPLALLAYTLLPLLLIWVGTQWRTQVIRSQNRKLERAVDERTAELARTNLELARLAKQKDRMVSVVAHDLRTPFAVADMYAGLLEQPPRENAPSLADTVAVIQRVSAQGINVIDSMLSLQAIESGRVRLDRKPTDVVALLRETVATQGKLLHDRRNIELRLETGVEEAVVPCDGPRVRQVVDNLVSNAAKYSSDGSVIRLGVAVAAEHVAISVRDEGVGIDTDDLEKVFKPYQRSGNVPVEQQVGLGIGLTVCRRLVELHGGTIGIDSAPGEGTTVRFFLPKQLPAEGDPEEVKSRDVLG